MSFYDDASIVMIPSGYKASKLYSAKPTDGSGDLVFTRTGSTATRVNESGLIERCRTNQVIFSEDFTNADWKKLYATVTGNTTISPNGTLTADSLFDNSSNQNHFAYKENVSLSAGVYTVSYYAKANTLSHCAIGLQTGSTLYSSGNFNLINGTISGAGVNGLSPGNIVSVGNGWYRVSFSANVTTGTFFIFAFTSNGTSTTYIGSGQFFYIWGYQLETGDIATDYIPTTTAAVTVGPIANLPRLDYTGGGCPKLLMEPTRTNLATYSEQFDNAAWTKRNITISSNSIVSPDGYLNADKLPETTANDRHDLFQGFSAVSGTTYSLSFFAKAAERTFCYASFGSALINGNNTYFNLSNGTVVSTPAGVTASIVDYGNGWYRCSITATASGSGTAYFVCGNSNNGTGFVYTGVSGSGIYLWGAQLEAGPYATSYIPTFNASVTRNADNASKTGISSLIGQTEGVLYAEIVYNGDASGLSNIIHTNNNTTSSVFIIRQSSGAISAAAAIGGVAFGQVVGGNIVAGSTFKIAYAYKSGSSELYINGVQIGTSAQAFAFTQSVSEIRLNDSVSLFANQQNLSFAKVLLFKTRLSNTDLATLTTL